MLLSKWESLVEWLQVCLFSIHVYHLLISCPTLGKLLNVYKFVIQTLHIKSIYFIKFLNEDYTRLFR